MGWKRIKRNLFVFKPLCDGNESNATCLCVFKPLHTLRVVRFQATLRTVKSPPVCIIVARSRPPIVPDAPSATTASFPTPALPVSFAASWWLLTDIAARPPVREPAVAVRFVRKPRNSAPWKRSEKQRNKDTHVTCISCFTCKGRYIWPPIPRIYVDTVMIMRITNQHIANANLDQHSLNSNRQRNKKPLHTHSARASGRPRTPRGTALRCRRPCAPPPELKVSSSPLHPEGWPF